MKASEVRHQVSAHQMRLSGKVDESLLDSVVMGGVTREQLVTNIQEIFPMQSAAKVLLAKGGWRGETHPGPAIPGRRVFKIFGTLEVYGAGEQKVILDQESGRIFLTTRNPFHRQDIVMDRDGRITRNTGKIKIQPAQKLDD